MEVISSSKVSILCKLF